jgi:isocitrate dehydrogenase
LDQATEKFLIENKSPSINVRELDNRGSHFYLTMYWAQALAAQNEDPALKKRFSALAEQLVKNETKIAQELIDIQGNPVDLGGYYKPDDVKAAVAMRPSITYNTILDLFNMKVI